MSKAGPQRLGTKKQTGDSSVTVLNPACTNNTVARIPLAPRDSNSLAGKIVYLVDIGWGGPDAAYDVFQVIEDRFSGLTPSIKTKLVRKRGPFVADDPELWDEIKAEGDACIIGISC